MKYDCVHRHLSKAFRQLGFHISDHPKWYIVIPLIVTAVFATGFTRASMEIQVEYLFTPIDGRSHEEKIAVEALFPRIKSHPLDFSRLTRLPPFGSVITIPKDGGNMLEESILDEVALLNSIVLNISVNLDNHTYNFQDICLREYDGECFKNEGLDVRGKVKGMKRGRYKIRYPVDVDLISYTVKTYGFNFGGVTSDDDGYVQEVKAIRLFYLLEDTKEKQVTDTWMSAFLNKLSNVRFDKILVYKFTRTSLDLEANKITSSSYWLLILAVIIMTFFAAVSCMTTDWVHSEPWVGVAGCISSLLGVASAFGSLLLFGAEYVDINIAIVFLMLGIGMDDSFVILGAWRNTDAKSDIKKRMGEAYAESATSITITSLTNLMASCTGLITSYRTIRLYSLYASAAIFFVYISQITFFGGCLALSGYREKDNRHSIVICYPIKNHPSSGIFRKIFIEGFSTKKYIHINNNPGSNILITRFFGYLGYILSKTYAKIAVIVIFLTYFGLAIYFMKDLVIAFDYTEAFPYYSYAKPYVDSQYRYFSEYPFRIQVIINKTLDYSNPSVRKDIETVIHRFETAPNMAGASLTESWLEQYLRFIDDKRISWFSLARYNMSNPEDFVEGLRDVFLRLKGAARFKNDVRFSEDGKKIVASRFLLQGSNVSSAILEKKFVESLWELADTSKYPVFVHNFYFFLYDLSSGVEKTTIQCLITSSVLVILTFLMFFPSVTCALSVASTIIFIEVELIGYMALWGVQLNIISMICLVLSVGLSVDYAAHISCAFMSNNESEPNAKLRRALLNVGYPITQGCASSIIGVIVLSYAPVESVVIFFKIVFLVMVCSLYHGLLLIPVMLSIWQEISLSIRKRRYVDETSKSSEACIKSPPEQKYDVESCC